MSNKLNICCKYTFKLVKVFGFAKGILRFWVKGCQYWIKTLVRITI